MTHEPWLRVNGIPVDEEITHIYLDPDTYDQFIRLWHVVETDDGPRWKPNPAAVGVWYLEEFPDTIMPIIEDALTNIAEFGFTDTRFTYDGTQEDHGDVSG